MSERISGVPESEMVKVEATDNERIPYDQETEANQVNRFSTLRELYKDQEIGADGEVTGSMFLDFFRDAHKYPERFTMGDATPEQIKATFENASRGNELIESALDYFLQAQKNKAGVENSLGLAQDDLETRWPLAAHFADSETGQLNVDQLANLFSWSVKLFGDGAAAIGREPKHFDDKQIQAMADDLRAILDHVNAMR